MLLFYPSIIAAKISNTKRCFRKREGLYCNVLLSIDGVTDKEDEGDEDLRIPVQPNNSLLFVYQSEWQKRLLERFLFFFFICAFFNSKLKKAVIMKKCNSYFNSTFYYTQKDV